MSNAAADAQQQKPESMTDGEQDGWLARLRTAWDRLPAGTQSQLKPMLDQGHSELEKYVVSGQPPAPPAHGTLRLKSYLTRDWDGHLQKLDGAMPLAARPATLVDSQGDILGTAKYEQFDPRWDLVGGTIWLENLLHKHPFPPGTPTVHSMADKVSFALVSDYGSGNFGTGEAPAIKISKHVPTLRPDYSVHLGDVYYAGTSDEEQNNLLALWPHGSEGSFALNSNHEMYSGGSPYFHQLLGSAPFCALQSPWSFFALENEQWIIVGLDSAYYASALGLYMNGTLGRDNAQVGFLQQMAARGKRLIVLTHHNPILLSGAASLPPLALYSDVMNACGPGRSPAWWYYGHVHAASVYKQQGDTLFRCLGHGAMPWGLPSDLVNSTHVEWFEKRPADPANSVRLLNGWVFLELDGPTLKETYYDENGGVAWTATHTS